MMNVHFRYFNKRIWVTSWFCITILLILSSCVKANVITHEPQNKTVLLSTRDGNFQLKLDYGAKCVINEMKIEQNNILAPTGIFSGVKAGKVWYTTSSGIPSPVVNISGDTVAIKGIQFGGTGTIVQEDWRFIVENNTIKWKIDRAYLSGNYFEDISFPCWQFNIKTWDGALLNNGGVAWCKLFDHENSSYGVHTDKVTFWDKDLDICLRIIADENSDNCYAVKFSRLPGDIFSFTQYVTNYELLTRYDHYRYFSDRQDIWKPVNINQKKITAEYTLLPLKYTNEYKRGEFANLNGEAISSIANTIARVGVIDSYLHGSNSWRTPYGPAVLHEQWIAQLGLAIDDPAYFKAYQKTLEFQRDHAIEKDGRVKSRWAYHDGDAMPASYDSLGFYECQWGYLLDSQPDFVINVSELYQFNGDLEWVRTFKSSCEKVLAYLLDRDSDGDYLVEMITDDHTDAKGSDWIDVIWASFENAFVNAELYYALTLWSDIEFQMGDSVAAQYYSDFAGELKQSFNKSIHNGGFWDPENKWYVYWRDKDDSIHGNNLVVPVNFMAIAYGLCEEKTHSHAILDRIETEMQNENLFCWPLCIYPYKDGEGLDRVNFPYPNYENGDIFLAWAELGIRAYVDYKPEIPVKYIKNVLKQYEKDGLAFQRYKRKTQTGAGDDILANNCSAIVGLYRNIYGIQPYYNRLYLNPHLTEELNGTRLYYKLRDQEYLITLNQGYYAIEVDSFVFHSMHDFAVDCRENTAQYFYRDEGKPSMVINKSGNEPLIIEIQKWDIPNPCLIKWNESSTNENMTTNHKIMGLEPDNMFDVYLNGEKFVSLKSNSDGKIQFKCGQEYQKMLNFEVKAGD